MRSTIRNTTIVGAIAVLAAVTGAARTTTPDSMTLSTESRLWLEGTSTARSFKCTAGKIDVLVASKPEATPSNLVQSASLVVPVSSLDCKNKTMNEHMMKALKAGANPKISWKLDSYRVTGTTVFMSGLLTIAGRTNPIEITGTGSADSKGVIRMTGSKLFKMSEYGVKPPSLMLGTMKVRDPVTVSFDLVLNP
ncbi:MAG: YceI family protein [Gemmatimonadales bacterium]